MVETACTQREITGQVWVISPSRAPSAPGLSMSTPVRSDGSAAGMARGPPAENRLPPLTVHDLRDRRRTGS